MRIYARLLMQSPRSCTPAAMTNPLFAPSAHLNGILRRELCPHHERQATIPRAKSLSCRFVHLESGVLKSWPHLDGANRLNPRLCSHVTQEQAFLGDVLLQNRPPGDAAARIGAHFLPPVGRIFRTDSGNERSGSLRSTVSQFPGRLEHVRIAVE